MFASDHRSNVRKYLGHALRFDGQHDQVAGLDDRAIVIDGARSGGRDEGGARFGVRVGRPALIALREPGIQPALGQRGRHFSRADKAEAWTIGRHTATSYG
jgi:hypothetical protein